MVNIFLVGTIQQLSCLLLSIPAALHMLWLDGPMSQQTALTIILRNDSSCISLLVTLHKSNPFIEELV